MKKILGVTCLLLSIAAHADAWTWKDLWTTRDQQASNLMRKKQFKAAASTFQDPAWQATAAFRAEDYEQASQSFAKLQTADGYYNQANALAHLGRYEEALQAYDNSLKINPKDPDTLHNKAIVEALLKKTQNPQEQKPQEQKPEEQKPQEKKPQEKKPQEKKPQEEKPQEKKPQKKKPQEQKPQEQKTQEQKPQEKKPQEQKPQEQQANKQWLQMIPDDPGGLLRQKFMRDHLRRTEGEDA